MCITRLSTDSIKDHLKVFLLKKKKKPVLETSTLGFLFCNVTLNFMEYNLAKCTKAAAKKTQHDFRLSLVGRNTFSGKTLTVVLSS